jgi:predicted flap endonuclease-1-like 5' DNA nuclease
MDNRTIAERLRDHAAELETAQAGVYRVRAYRRAAESVAALEQPLKDVLENEGRAGLEAIPGIGSHLAFTIEELIRTGEFKTLRPTNADVEPEKQLTSLPGVGPFLAYRLRERLGVTTPEQLERAAEEGRLAEVGIGPKRLRGVLDVLAGRRLENRVNTPNEPTIEDLLAVDADYREYAEAGQLFTITPHKQNPNGERWLPVFSSRRGRWRYRVLYSNTAVAHRLNKTRDWVVIYFNDGTTSGQRTVVTEKHGDLVGRRVVRGRERECRALSETPEPAA